MRLSDKLRDLRGKRTLKEVSDQTGLSVSFLSDIEHGRSRPSLFSLERLAQHYDQSVVDLLLGTDLADGPDKPDYTFTYDLDDGRVAKCWQAISQSYQNCEFSAGLVFELPPEDIYVCLRRDGQEPSYWFMRRDEVEAMLWVMSGALWSLSMFDMRKYKTKPEEVRQYKGKE